MTDKGKDVPENPNRIGHGKDREYWMEKWGVSEKRLSEAIEQTESSEVQKVEEYLKSHKYI